jgi:hypothetical protein
VTYRPYATDSSSTQTSGAARTSQGDGGVTRALEIIPAKRFEVILAIPAYVVNNPDSPKNRSGDRQFLVNYRIAAGNTEHGNYILDALSQATLGPMHQPRRDGLPGKVIQRETF